MRKVLAVAISVLLSFSPVFAQNLVQGSIKDAPMHEPYSPSFKTDGSKKAPLNVILMIGDGTGLGHIVSGYYANGGNLTVMNLKAMGLVTTQSADAFITDSAASGTAYATGQKTYNSAIGVDVDKKPIQNIPEAVSEVGMISGVVTTDGMDGATPAAFFAHQPYRGMSRQIWADLPGSKLSFFAGGDKGLFERQSDETKDAIKEKFSIFYDIHDPAIAKADRAGVLPPHSETTNIKDGRTDFLPIATRTAIDFLSQHCEHGKGFFLMVEGARIDKSAHANSFDGVVLEVLDFDEAIAEAIRFADEDGHTLVVISADHETGGLVIKNGNPDKGDMEGMFTTGGHTASPVPLFAYGPHSQDFMGVQGNEEVAQKILKLLLGK